LGYDAGKCSGDQLKGVSRGQTLKIQATLPTRTRTQNAQSMEDNCIQSEMRPSMLCTLHGYCPVSAWNCSQDSRRVANTVFGPKPLAHFQINVVIAGPMRPLDRQLSRLHFPYFDDQHLVLLRHLTWTTQTRWTRTSHGWQIGYPRKTAEVSRKI
jgi:hypothetical protein